MLHAVLARCFIFNAMACKPHWFKYLNVVEQCGLNVKRVINRKQPQLPTKSFEMYDFEVMPLGLTKNISSGQLGFFFAEHHQFQEAILYSWS